MPAIAVFDRARVLTLFEKHRATPGAPFDEGHFMDYLLADPRGKQAAFRTFSGRRRVDAFTKAVQLDFGVCFSVEDRKSNYPLDNFVKRIDVLRRAPRSSLAAFRRQRREGFGGPALIVADVAALAALAGCMFAWPAFQALAGLVLLLVIVVNAWLVKSHLRERAYREQLRARLRQSRPE